MVIVRKVWIKFCFYRRGYTSKLERKGKFLLTKNIFSHKKGFFTQSTYKDRFTHGGGMFSPAYLFYYANIN